MFNFFREHSIGLLAPIALLQVCFIPGLIIISKLRFKNNIFLFVSIIFALSLVTNYLWVLSLTTLKILSWKITCAFLIIEFIYIFVFIKSISQQIRESLQITKLQIQAIIKPKHNYYLLIFLSTVLIISTSFLLRNINDRIFGTIQVFTAWDAVVSWNRWAVSWSQNQFPTLTWEYPQLIPANWALTYLILGNEKIEFVAKNLMYLFPVFGLISFVGLSLYMSKIEIILGAIFSVYLIEVSQAMIHQVGYVDIPVSIFAAILFSSGFNVNLFNEQDKFPLKTLLVLGTIGGGAIAIKQTGAFVFASFIIIFYINQLRKRSFKSQLICLTILIIPAIAIGSSWYVLKYFLIQDFSSNYVQLVSDPQLHQESFIFKRMTSSFEKYFSSYFLIFSVILSLIPRFGKLNFLTHIVWFYLIPWTLIWSAFFSYDNRNLFPVYTSLGLVSGANLYFLLANVITRIKPIKVLAIKYINHKNNSSLSFLSFFIILSLLISIYLNVYVQNNYNSFYLTRQQEAKLERGSYTINRKILKYFQSKEKSDLLLKVATDYQYLGFIPGLKPRYKYYNLNQEDHQNLAIQDQEVGYLLFIKCPESKILSQKISFMFSQNNEYCFYEKIP
ncbi:MAG TPA: hypothetical protein DCF68_02420 [Cyanothece sp. UBA12306]|nr:hypothetical protein [Cyanothece sp. UBA12306]